MTGSQTSSLLKTPPRMRMIDAAGGMTDDASMEVHIEAGNVCAHALNTLQRVCV